MIWQDFMFACGIYPDRQWFLDKVKTEAVATVAELRNHPCIIIWCGNNEIDWMYHAGSFGKGRKFYGKCIYHKFLPELLNELDPDRPYIPTTPFSSSEDPNDPRCGTVHNWDVWSRHEPVWRYVRPTGQIPRFTPEFGFQAPPVIETIARFCPPAHRRVASYLLEKHNYQVEGNGRLYRYLGDLFGTAGCLDHFVYLSQLTQARAIKTYVEFLRAHRSVNSGALFWQFNDCCPAISWSAIDYLKRPKALYYYAKRFFAELLITAVPELDDTKVGSAAQLKSLNVAIVNDTVESLTVQLSCRLIDLSGKLLDQVQLPVSVAPFSASRPVRIPQSIVSCPHPEKSAWHLLVKKDGVILAENLFLLLPDKYIDWPVADIATELSRLSPTEARLKLTSANLAKDVRVEIEGCAKLSDNFVDLIPGSPRELTVTFDNSIDQFPPKIKLLSVESALGVQMTRS
jgi:beta-mannosidase